jgi:hypothetical protein
MHWVTRFLLCTLSLFATDFWSPKSAHATDIFAAVGLKASVGVDEATRDWISGLPEQLRPGINNIVEDTLSSANRHFDQALENIRTELAEAENDFACRWQAGNQQTIQIWESHIPFLKQPEPIRDLQDYIEQQRKDAVNHKLDPTYMVGLYSDLEDQVGIVNCEQISDDAKTALKAITDDLSRRFVIWLRLNALKCGDQSTCFSNYKAVVQKSSDAAQKIDGLDDTEKAAIAKATTDLASVNAPLDQCGVIQDLRRQTCYNTDDYEDKLIALGNADDLIRLVTDVHSIEEELDGAIVTTHPVDPGSLKSGSTLRSPNNKYFAVMGNDCSFRVYKGAYTTDSEYLAPKYVVESVEAPPKSSPLAPTYSNCHLDLQRDRNLILYADVVSTVLGQISRAPNSAIWSAGISDGGNADYWLLLLDTGEIEIHAGAPFKDGGALYSTKLLANKALEFDKVQAPPPANGTAETK